MSLDLNFYDDQRRHCYYNIIFSSYHYYYRNYYYRGRRRGREPVCSRRPFFEIYTIAQLITIIHQYRIE